MIAILLSDDGSIFKVFDPKTKVDLTEKYEMNMLVIQTKDGKYKGGFHIGQDCTEQIEQAKQAAEALATEELEKKPEAVESYLGDASVGEPADGGRYGRG